LSGNCQKLVQMKQIKVYDRDSKQIFNEKVYGQKALQFVYNNPLGKIITPLIVYSPLSKIYGCLQDSFISRVKPPKFIKDFNINIDEYEAGSLKTSKIEESYQSFNEFFIRKFKLQQRAFVEADQLPAIAEARYVAYDEIDSSVSYPVKGKNLSIEALINNPDWSHYFTGGPLLIARLCPVDYHRYHYPDTGKNLISYSVRGKFYSVNPVALKFNGEIFIQNERRVSILETEQFGKLAYIEVGATMVGKIVQSHDEHLPFKRGDEKGYFLFGASTVILIGEKGKWLPSKDIVENTKNGIETYIKLGQEIGVKLKS